MDFSQSPIIDTQEILNSKKTRKNPFPQFKQLLWASIIYAAIFTFCRYKNPNGIFASLDYAATLAYVFYAFKALGYKIKRGFIFTAVIYMIIGANIFVTLDGVMLTFDRIGGALVLLAGMIHQCYDDSTWGFGKYFTSLNQVFWCSFGHIIDPYVDASHAEKNDGNESKNKNIKYILIGLLTVIPMAVIVIILLSSADMMFSKMFKDFFVAIQFGDIILILLMLFTVFSASYALIRKLSFHDITENIGERKTLSPVIGITFNSVLTVIYLIFSVFQFVFLFFGAGLPEGYTYAEYAHEGFYQLVAVSILNIVIVFVSKVIFDKNKLLNAVLTVTSLCTFVMIASSFYRMILYIGAYQLSELRILTLWALVVITLIMAAICIYIFCPKFPIMKTIVIIVSCLYIVLAFSHPTRIIAKYNMKVFLETGVGDLDYISNLNEATDAYIYADEYLAVHEDSSTKGKIENSKKQFHDTIYLEDQHYSSSLFAFRKYNPTYSHKERYILESTNQQ